MQRYLCSTLHFMHADSNKLQQVRDKVWGKTFQSALFTTIKEVKVQAVSLTGGVVKAAC